MLQLPRTPVCSALSSRIYPLKLKLQGLLNSSAPTLHSADGLECETIVRFLSFRTPQPSHTCVRRVLEDTASVILLSEEERWMAYNLVGLRSVARCSNNVDRRAIDVDEAHIKTGERSLLVRSPSPLPLSLFALRLTPNDLPPPLAAL